MTRTVSATMISVVLSTTKALPGVTVRSQWGGPGGITTGPSRLTLRLSLAQAPTPRRLCHRTVSVTCP
eukprot:756353-Hanusia_phi.AAC.1